jgi:hypothetical protein
MSSTLSPMQLRRQLVDTLQLMQSQTTPSRTEREKAGHYLLSLAPKEGWYPFLLKELETCENSQHKRLEAITDLMMEIGELKALQKPLYAIVANPNVADDVKDVIHVMLRSLGDEVDPEFFFENMKDPEGLLEREALRVFEMAEENPDAMTEFIEAFLDVPAQELFDILNSVEASVPSKSIVHFALPLLLQVSTLPKLRMWLLKSLGNSGSILAAWGIYNRYFKYPSTQKVPLNERKEAEIALKKLQLSGVYQAKDAEQLDTLSHVPPSWASNIKTQDAYCSYISEKGDQVFLLVTEWHNGDFALLMTFCNDELGIVDAMVQNYLTKAEMKRWMIHFDDSQERLKMPLSEFRKKLLARETLSFKKSEPLPYMYTAWRSLLFTLDEGDEVTALEHCATWQNDKYKNETYTLIHEDAFDEWSLKAYHNPRLDRLFYELIAEWQSLFDDFLQQFGLAGKKPSKKNLKKASEPFKNPTDFIEYLDTWATSVKEALEENGSAQVLKERLADVACLYKWQNKRKLPALIATEIAQFEEPLHEKRFLMQLIRRYALYTIEDFCAGDQDKMKFFIRFVNLLEQTWDYLPVLHD